MMKGKAGKTEEGKARRENFENGISVEGEFAFTKAVAACCKAAVREGTYRGNYLFNIKEQMEQRAEGDGSLGEKVRVLTVGGSQMGKIGKELGRKGREVVESSEWVKVKGRLDREEVQRILA